MNEYYGGPLKWKKQLDKSLEKKQLFQYINGKQMMHLK